MNSEYAKNAVRLIKKHSIISFDMYDTLVHRAVVSPKHIFELASIYNSCAYVHGEHVSYIDMPSLRSTSEADAREKCFATTNTRELTILEIYAEIAHKLQNKELVQSYLEAELFTEKRFSYGSTLHKKLFKIAQALGKKVVVATDMYLEPKFLEEILAMHGYAKPYELFVSGYTCLPKYDGKFFSYVQREHMCENDSFVHIGDNVTSDVQAPADAGFTSLLYSRGNDHVLPLTSTIEASLACGISSSIHNSHPKVLRSPARKLGVEVYGPLLFGFMLWITKELRKQHSEAVLFSMRDMHLVLRLLRRYKKMLHIEQDLIPLHISRKALAEPAMYAYDNHYLKFFCTSAHSQSLEELCAKLTINYYMYAALFNQCGLNDKDEIVDMYDTRVLLFVSQILPQLQRTRLESTKNVLQYMDTICKKFTNFTYIDVGYSGTIPVYLFRFLKRLRPEKTFASLLLAKNTYPHPDFAPQSFLDKLAPEYFENGFCELLEIVLTSNQKSTTSYRSTATNRAVPVLSGKICQKAYAFSKDVSAGVELFVDTAMQYIDGYTLDALTGEGWGDNFLRFVHKPSIREAQLFVDLEHNPNVLTNDTKKILSSGKGLSSITMQQLHADSIWKSGCSVVNNRVQP